MTIQEFNNQFESFFDSLVKRVKEKQIEYGRNDNPFHNFETDGKINNILPEIALHNYLSKHLVSYLSMIKDIEQGKSININLADEKLGDIIVYLGILKVMINNKYKNQENVGNHQSD